MFTFQFPSHLPHQRLHDLRLERRRVPQQVLYRLHHVHVDQFFLGIDPEVGAGVADLAELAD